MRSMAISMILLTLGACQQSAPDSPPAPNSETPSATATWPTPEPGAAPKVLLVGWDGVRPDILREVSTPAFDALAQSGSFSEAARTAQPTVSGPCWSSILTGVWPEKHGVVSNDFSPNRYAAYPDLFTRIEEARPELNTFVVADWLPLVSETDGGPVVSDAVDRKIVLDGYERGWPEADSVSVAAAVAELQAADPDILFVYIGSPDEISHNIGGIGPEYRESIATADRHLGKLLQAIRRRPSFGREDWLVLVVTDHGRTETGGHGGDTPEERTIFYMASGPSARKGPPTEPPAVVDIATTAFAHLGVPLGMDWDLDGRIAGLNR